MTIPSFLLHTLLLALLALAPSSASPAAPPRPVALARQDRPAATIYFAADDRARLYINGKLKAETKGPKVLGKAFAVLKVGDVVGVYARDVGGGYGVVITVVMPNGVRYRTGKAMYVARSWFKIPGNPLAWATSEYNACGWPDAVLSPASDSSIAKPNNFPAPMAGAQYVWAASAKGAAGVLVRLKIGGEKCDTSLSRVFLAADDSAKMFVNGKLVLSVSKPGVLVQTRSQFKKGDVIAIQARDVGGNYGVIAAIITPMMKILTGSGAWRAVGWYKMPQGLPGNAWTKSDFSVCSWPAPIIAPKGYAVPASLPEEMNGATYVWAADVAGTTSIFLRYRIGGESCSGKLVRISFTADDVASLYVNGKFVATNKDSMKVTSVQVQVSKGSVIGIIAKDNGQGYGVLAAVVDGAKTFATGSKFWRARKSFLSNAGYFAWTKPSFKQCFPIAPPTSAKMPLIVTPKNLPAELKSAKYVWAKDAGVKKNIFLRFRYGGGC